MMAREEKQLVTESENITYEDGQSSESVSNALQLRMPQDTDDNSHTTLQLGYYSTSLLSWSVFIEYFEEVLLFYNQLIKS